MTYSNASLSYEVPDNKFYEGKCQQLTPQVIFHLVNLLWRELYKPTKKILYKEVNKTVLRVALSITSAFLVIVWCKVVAFSSYFSTWLHMQCNRMCGKAIKTRLLESDISAILIFSTTDETGRKDKGLGLRVSNKEQKDKYSNVHVLFLIYTISWGGFTCLYSKFKYK